MGRRLFEILTQAIFDFARFGFDRQTRLNDWLRTLGEAAREDVKRKDDVEGYVRRSLETFYKRSLSKRSIFRRHPQVPHYTIERIAPQLRPELTKRIQASADLIKLNREQAIEKTLQRFSGWASSVPAGGSRAIDKREIKKHIAQPLAKLSFEERRVAIDQGHKLMSSIDAVVAKQTGAIAMMWRSHWRDPSYDYRPDHKARDKKIYAIRGSWAMEKGLMNKGSGYSDEMTQPAEGPFCRCYAVYINNLRDLPEDMLTEKGKDVLKSTTIKRA